MEQKYDNKTKANFLIGEVTLRDLPTQLLYEGYDEADLSKRPSIRISIGWRNPQEDAYDITSLVIDYTKDETITATCVDGYANGSISTKLYNPQIKKPFYTQKWDNYDIHNITIKEWTDNVDIVDETGLPDGENYKKMSYRLEENQDCQILSQSVTKYPKDDLIRKNKQTFTIEYIKPFVSTDLQDITLLPGLDYNITSYFGCYKTDSEEVGAETIYKKGSNPNVFYQSNGVGCRGSLQGRTGILIYEQI